MHTIPRKEAETRHLPKTCDEPRTIAIIAPAPPKKIPNIHSVVVEYSQMPASFKIETNTMAGTPRRNDTAVSSTSGAAVPRRAADRLGGKLGVYRAVSRKAEGRWLRWSLRTKSLISLRCCLYATCRFLCVAFLYIMRS
jgi:hypothetical protein